MINIIFAVVVIVLLSIILKQNKKKGKFESLLQRISGEQKSANDRHLADIKIVRVHRLRNSPVAAFFDIEVSGFRINGFKLMNCTIKGKDSYFIQAPLNKNHWEVAYPVNPDYFRELQGLLIRTLEEENNEEVGLKDKPKTLDTGQGLILQDEEAEKLSEEELLKKYLPVYENLVHGRTKPRNKCEKDFIERCNAIAGPKNMHAIVYIKYKRKKISEILDKQENGIPEYEEGYPKPGFFTDEDWKKGRARQYGDMKWRWRT